MKKCWFIARRRRKGKEERERGKRERESCWCLGLEVHVFDASPTKMHVFTLLPPLLVFQKLKTTESCLQFS